jgi:eukaryotic-like serine/threonine-protein kinase
MNVGFLRRLFRAASITLLLVAAFLLSAIMTMHFAIHGAEVNVPSLKGMTVAEARSETSGLGLNLDVDNRYYSADVAGGHIVSQSPAPGAVVRREWRVRVAESLGPQKVDVPQTVGSDERLATLRLQRAGLEVGAVARMPFDKVTAGTVIAQDPPAHALGIEEPSVNLLVAAENDQTADGFVMPNLAGMPIVTAQATLTRAGLKAGTPRFVNMPAAQAGVAAPMLTMPGTVIAQLPQAGARVDGTTAIALTVAK